MTHADELAPLLNSLFETDRFTNDDTYHGGLSNTRSNIAIHQGLKFLDPRADGKGKYTGFRKDLQKRLMDDAANLDPILGELRAFGALRAGGFDVDCVTRKKNAPSQDFEICLHGGAPMRVEVFTKQWDGAMASEYHAFQNTPGPAKPGVHFREFEVMPLGKPTPGKPGDSVATNAVSRLASIKPGNRQLPPGQPNILFIDLMRPDPLPLVESDHTLPLSSFNAHLTTGVVFAAVYGRKGLPLYESRPIEYGAGRVHRMAHDGRFAQDNGSLSAIVTQHQDGLVLLENPNATAPLSAAVRNQWICCPGAKLEYFWAAFTGREALAERIEQAFALHEYFWDLDAD